MFTIKVLNGDNYPVESEHSSATRTGSKVASIKMARAITGLGLKEAKELVEGKETELTQVDETRTVDWQMAELEKQGFILSNRPGRRRVTFAFDVNVGEERREITEEDIANYRSMMVSGLWAFLELYSGVDSAKDECARIRELLEFEE